MSSTRASAKRAFLVRVYLHLTGALTAFALFEAWMLTSGVGDRVYDRLVSVPWILILAAFMVVGWLARKVAWKIRSKPAQYLALASYVVAKGLIVLPLLVRVQRSVPGALEGAVQLTLLAAVGLTWVAWSTGADFSFLRGLLRWGGILAILAIVGALSFGWHLGTWFNVGMIGLAGAAILEDTSWILRRYRGGREVAAALSLFASVAMMFFYLLRQMARLGRS